MRESVQLKEKTKLALAVARGPNGSEKEVKDAMKADSRADEALFRAKLEVSRVGAAAVRKQKQAAVDVAAAGAEAYRVTTLHAAAESEASNKATLKGKQLAVEVQEAREAAKAAVAK